MLLEAGGSKKFGLFFLFEFYTVFMSNSIIVHRKRSSSFMTFIIRVNAILQLMINSFNRSNYFDS